MSDFKRKKWWGNPDKWDRVDDWIFPNRKNSSINTGSSYRIKHVHSSEKEKYELTNSTGENKCLSCNKKIPIMVNIIFMIEILSQKGD